MHTTTSSSRHVVSRDPGFTPKQHLGPGLRISGVTIKWFFLVSLLLPPSLVHAQWNLVVIPELLSAANADQHFKDVARDSAVLLPGASASVRTTAGYGIRVGLMRPLPLWQNTYVGGTMGYVVGPRVKWTVSVPSGSFGEDNRQYYVRALAEGVHVVPIRSQLAFKLGAGLGVARGETRQTPFYTGSFSGSTSEATHSNVGFSWEISPALLIDLKATVLELGIRYMQFPTIFGTNQTTKVSWTPFGFYIGLGF